MPRSLSDRANVDPEAVRSRAALCHLSAVLGFLVPFGAVLAPYVAWRLLRETDPFVDRHGRQAVDLNLAFLGLEVALFAVAGAATVFLRVPAIVVPALAAALLVGLVHVGAILHAAIQANAGEELGHGFRVRVLSR